MSPTTQLSTALQVPSRRADNVPSPASLFGVSPPRPGQLALDHLAGKNVALDADEPLPGFSELNELNMHVCRCKETRTMDFCC